MEGAKERGKEEESSKSSKEDSVEGFAQTHLSDVASAESRGRAGSRAGACSLLRRRSLGSHAVPTRQ